MKNKIIITILTLTFFLPLAMAFNATTSTYEVESFHQGLAGGNSTTSSYDFRFTTTYTSGNPNITTTEYKANIGWFPIITFNVIVEEEEDEEPTPPPSGGPSGGGGAPTCIYDWVCTDWYPQPCPESGIQERVCVNKGTCTGLVGIPEQNRTCEYLEEEPLFDIILNIPLRYKAVLPGSKVKADVEIKNIQKIQEMDVYLKYWIIDENHTLIAEKQDTLGVEEKLNFERTLQLPKETHLGLYKFYAQITYDIDNKTAVASDSFYVTEKKYLAIFLKYIKTTLYIILSIIIFLTIIFIIYKLCKKIKKRKPIKKNNKRKKSL